MARELILSISGMRGIIGENLSPEIAVAYGCAFGTFLKGRAQAGAKLAVVESQAKWHTESVYGTNPLRINTPPRAPAL